MTRPAAPTLAPRLDRSLELDVVVVATNRAEVLDATVHRLHAALTVGLSTTWRLTIVDHASHDSTGEVAERLARELVGVRSERVAERLTRAAMHGRWASSPAVAVTFVELTPGLDVDATVALLARRAASAPVRLRPHLRPMSRRTALAGIGGLGLTAVLAACGRSGSGSSATTSGASASTTSAAGAASTASTTATSTATSTTTSAATGTATTSASTGATATTGPSEAAEVVLVPELTEGPYYLDLDLVRGDIREDRQGAPLVLDMRIVDAATGDPIPGASVDLWHCDAEGEYSGFVSASEGDTGGRSGPGRGAPPSGGGGGGATATDDSIFLRGTQVAGDDGTVRFTTMYPGWYTGRSVHMHIKVHVSGDVTHTSQLFFDDAFTDEVYASTEPYASQGERDQRNDDDGIFGQGGEAMTLDVAPSGSGYASAISLGVSA